MDLQLHVVCVTRNHHHVVNGETEITGDQRLPISPNPSGPGTCHSAPCFSEVGVFGFQGSVSSRTQHGVHLLRASPF